MVISRSSLALAFKDIKDGVGSVYIWGVLGWQDIKQRYRRSLIGPFWLTISTGAMIGGMGPLYGRLFNLDISTYFPYLAISFILWMFISGLINDACVAFIAAEGHIKQIKLPLTVHILRMVWKNLIVFAHNLVIIFAVLLIWPPTIGWHVLTVPWGVLAIAINGVWLGILLGLLCARFRDIPQIVSSLLQIVFFLTPVIWKADMPTALTRYSLLWSPRDPSPG